MEEKDQSPSTEPMVNENPAVKNERPEIPIARNANPAGVSTARTVADLPMEVAQGQSEGSRGASADEPAKAEYPIARNANPTGVSTARTRESSN